MQLTIPPTFWHTVTQLYTTLALEMETEDASETSVTIHRPIWRHNADAGTYTVHLFTADYY